MITRGGGGSSGGVGQGDLRRAVTCPCVVLTCIPHETFPASPAAAPFAPLSARQSGHRAASLTVVFFCCLNHQASAGFQKRLELVAITAQQHAFLRLCKYSFMRGPCHQTGHIVLFPVFVVYIEPVFVNSFYPMKHVVPNKGFRISFGALGAAASAVQRHFYRFPFLKSLGIVRAFALFDIWQLQMGICSVQVR